jgi:hypothetical protein
VPLVAVIPAKAGIHSANLRKCAVEGLDSRFRRNDQRFERDPIPNDTNTQPWTNNPARMVLRCLSESWYDGGPQRI